MNAVEAGSLAIGRSALATLAEAAAGATYLPTYLPSLHLAAGFARRSPDVTSGRRRVAPLPTAFPIPYQPPARSARPAARARSRR